MASGRSYEYRSLTEMAGCVWCVTDQRILWITSYLELKAVTCGVHPTYNQCPSHVTALKAIVFLIDRITLLGFIPFLSCQSSVSTVKAKLL